MTEIEAAWAQPQADWARRRLLVVRLIAQHELTVAEIMRVADVSRQTVFTYRDKVVAGGVARLLERGKAPGNRPAVRGAVQTEFLARLAEGKFRRAKDAQAWIRKRTRKTLTESGVSKVLRRLGGKLKVPRKSHAKKDPAKAAAFKLELPGKLAAVVGPAVIAQPVRFWVLDEHATNCCRSSAGVRKARRAANQAPASWCSTDSIRRANSSSRTVFHSDS